MKTIENVLNESFMKFYMYFIVANFKPSVKKIEPTSKFLS